MALQAQPVIAVLSETRGKTHIYSLKEAHVANFRRVQNVVKLRCRYPLGVQIIIIINKQ